MFAAQVPSLRKTPAYARALYERGVRDATELALAPDELVRQALLAALPRALKAAAAAKTDHAAAKCAFPPPCAALSFLAHSCCFGVPSGAAHAPDCRGR